jgi:hypothetical protein
MTSISIVIFIVLENLLFPAAFIEINPEKNF